MSTPRYAGLRRWAKARSTGTTVAIYDGDAAGMDTDAGRWQTVCETHGTVISHSTLALARSHAAAPDDWCEACGLLPRGHRFIPYSSDRTRCDVCLRTRGVHRR